MDGNFLDAEGRPADLHAQRVSTPFMVNQLPADEDLDPFIFASQELCAHISPHHLIGSRFRTSAPDLQPVDDAAKMSGGSEEVRRCFLAPRAVSLQHEGAHQAYWSFRSRLTDRSQLNSIDNMRIDGKFMVGDEIPDGQANVIELLEECFELAYELRVQAEDESEEEKKDEKEEGEEEKEDDTEDKSDDEDGSLAMKAK